MLIMKKGFIALFFALVAFVSNAQKASPAASASAKIGETTLTINYHQPSVKGRNVWDPAGSLAPFGKVWRTGANNAPSFEVSKDVTIEGKALKAGKYAIFTIPGEKEWVIIINKDFKQWGNYDYKESEDVLRVTVPAVATDMTERFTIKAEDSGKVTLAWDKLAASFIVK